ncbi:hypothetical protein [uncultured Enterobacter sp.]|uniref:hypothetical protein n=1 Tax=uncultured Enterobacter sp. TaxID=238202 RepID=UPI0025967D9A|nr:hypothetical protein [uncultured Enterobacter sp.]
MDESRKQFEAEIEHSYGEDFLAVNDDGDYANWITADLWEFWVKSRAVIEIELPPKVESSPYEHYMPHYTMDADSVESAIRAAGIKVKE